MRFCKTLGRQRRKNGRNSGRCFRNFNQNNSAFELYQKMSYTHRKEYMRWITDAKKPETRETEKLK